MCFRSSVRRLALAFLAFVPATALSAQQIALSGVPWGAPADSVRARLEAGGYAFERASDSGDHLYRRGDGAWVAATLRAGRAIGFAFTDAARGDGVDARYAALADSLRAALGEPDESGKQGSEPRPALLWVAGLASVELWVEGPSPTRQVVVSWRGPGWHDEMARRREEPLPPAGFTIVGTSPFLRIAIDTTTGAGQRARFRIEYRQPVTPNVGGVQQEPMDVAEYEMDVDCAGRRTRLVARTTFLEGRRLGGVRPEGQPWTVPQPDGHYARGRDAVCRARRGRR
jgi:hypothetical protein